MLFWIWLYTRIDRVQIYVYAKYHKVTDKNFMYTLKLGVLLNISEEMRQYERQKKRKIYLQIAGECRDIVRIKMIRNKRQLAARK